MDQKAQSAANRVYQDFEPFFEWAEEEGSVTLIVLLPGFSRDQLSVQVTSTPILRINGERQITENIWRRFAKEFSIPPYCDTDEVSAKFERGILYVKFAKLITPAKAQEELATNPPEDEAPMPQQQQPRADEPKALAQEIDQQKSRQPISDEKEKRKTEEAAANKVVAEKKKLSETETTEATTSKAHEKEGANMTHRLKTRVLDFTTPSLRPADNNHDQDVNQGCLIKGWLIKRPKKLMNMIVAVLLVIVIGMYIRNAFTSSQEQGSKFQEF